MSDISAVPVFAAVMEYGSFSAAAEHLGVTKSAVSKRVSALEAQLGVKLLNRSTRKLSLTEAGARYLEHAQRALEAARDAESAATELQDIPRGTLHVSMPMSFGRLYLAPLIPGFLKDYPNITLHVDMNDSARDVLAEGFDIALRAGNLPDSSLFARKIAPLRSVLCASPHYVEEHGAPASPEELVGRNCLLYTYHSEANQWTFFKDDEELSVRVAGNYQVNNSEALREALIQGMGVGRLPTFIANKEIRSGTLVPLLPDWVMPWKDLYAVFPERKYRPEKLRVFTEFLMEQIGGDVPKWDTTT